MSFLCKIGLHSWNGCKCKRCGKIRDEQHDFRSDCEKCSKCGKVRDEQHNWSKDCEKCSVCGKVRSNQHHWDGCKCSKCGKTRDEQHDWSKDCEKCSKCGKIRSEQHDWNKTECSKCGKRQNTCTITYVFNSDIIIDEGLSDYGGYTEKELIKVISSVLEPEGGWKSLPALVEACYGDLIERPIFGSSRVELFRHWLNNGRYGANRNYLDLSAINKDSNLGYVPYIIGVSNIYPYQALATHQLLKNNNVKGYQGLCIFDQTFNFSKLSDELSLVPDIVARGKEYSLWWTAQH